MTDETLSEKIKRAIDGLATDRYRVMFDPRSKWDYTKGEREFGGTYTAEYPAVSRDNLSYKEAVAYITECVGRYPHPNYYLVRIND